MTCKCGHLLGEHDRNGQDPFGKPYSGTCLESGKEYPAESGYFCPCKRFKEEKS